MVQCSTVVLLHNYGNKTDIIWLKWILGGILIIMLGGFIWLWSDMQTMGNRLIEDRKKDAQAMENRNIERHKELKELIRKR